jgi:hypothetical protein
MLRDAWSVVCTAPSACLDVCSENASGAPAVNLIATALSPTMRKTFSTRSRKEPIAASMEARR